MPHSVRSTEVQAAFGAAASPVRRKIAVDGDTREITCPFPSPEDWRDRWIYFALVDRFCNPATPPVHAWDQPFGAFQGGTIEGLRSKLGYLQRLGVGAIWISPVLQNCQGQDGTYHGYGIQHFLRVDPRFASDRRDPDAELRRLVDEAHARGMHVIMDIVLNHAGDVFAYVDGSGATASAMPWRDDEYDIRWRGADDRPVAAWSDAPADGAEGLTEAAAIWPSELRTNAAFRRKGRGGEAGGDFESLKEFVSARPEVRSALIRCYQHAIAKWDVDGFRIDTLKYIEPDFALTFGNAVREYALEIGKRNFFTYGEVYDDESKIATFIGRGAGADGDIVGVDAALDFPLFFRLPDVVKGFAPPTAVSDVFEVRRQVERGVVSSHGEAGRFFVTFLDNHDQHARFHFADPGDPRRFDGQTVAALACLMALQGIPCVYYGTEQGLSGRGDTDTVVREALWGKPGAFDERDPLYLGLQRLSAVRLACPALRYGRQYLRPVSGDGQTFGRSTLAPGVLAFSRILNETEIVCVLNADAGHALDISVLIDDALNEVGARFETVFSSTGGTGAIRVERSFATIVDGGISTGLVKHLRVPLAAGEMRILRPA